MWGTETKDTVYTGKEDDMCGLAEDNILKELLFDKLHERIPFWFDKHESGPLLKALENGELVEIDEIADLLEEEIYPVIQKMVDDIFCGERIRTIGEKDIGDEVKKILGEAIGEMNTDADFEYETVEDEIKEAAATLRTLRIKLKKMPKPQKK